MSRGRGGPVPRRRRAGPGGWPGGTGPPPYGGGTGTRHRSYTPSRQDEVMQLSRIAVAGASGLIGSVLTRSLTADGHAVVRLVRREPRDETEGRWGPEAGRVDTAGLAGCDAVVNLAGAGVGSRRWTDAYKKRIHDSRVNGTTA